ncbi:MAG: 23S rRNA (cytosine(1962)-C(5))-methyltransferase RlmI [Anaerolineales bacterium]|nr:MAG: 23S rRNA (cytosine(1962)-C(5))-methyltransferase RlmI [Anaerolineales bacterium]
MKSIELKAGRERPVLRRHPWIFSGAIAEVRGNPDPGETVEILDEHGEWLAQAAYSPHSQIRARIWTWDREESIDEAFIEKRILASVNLRTSLRQDPRVNAYREVHAESDLIPGLIVDRYDSFRVVQFLNQGAERYREAILNILSKDPEIEGIFERSDADVRELEGLGPKVGTVWGSDPPERIKILENDLQFWVDVYNGHKTGFYLDQRQNRTLVRPWVSGDVLDAFCYTGAFSVAAIAGGAQSIVSVDSSAQALALTAENIALNYPLHTNHDQVEADVFQFLRTCRDSRRSFDTIFLDPPKFAGTSSQVEKAARGYKDINLLAFKLLRPGGVLITFSCSGGVSQDLFQKIVADAALDAGVEASVHAVLGQADDHPVRLQFPEGRYLKGFVCRLHG